MGFCLCGEGIFVCVRDTDNVLLLALTFPSAFPIWKQAQSN